MFQSTQLSVLIAVSKMLVMLFMLSHMIGCIMYAIVHGFGSDDYGDWLPVDAPLGERYMQCFHFAIALFFGEHANKLVSFMERFFTSLTLALTFTLQIWFVSFITSAMTKQELIATDRLQKFSALNKFMTLHKVPRELAVKVERNANHAVMIQENSMPEDTVELLKLVSEPLKMELQYEIKMPKMRVHPLWRIFETNDPPGLRKICYTAAISLHHIKHDVLFFEMESSVQSLGGPRMFFTIEGEMEYIRHDFLPETVTKDAWVAEGSLWVSEWIHCGTLRTLSQCRTIAVTAGDFQALTSESRNAQAAYDYATFFVKMLNDTDISAISDIGEYTLNLADIISKVFPDSAQAKALMADFKNESDGGRRSGRSIRGDDGSAT